MCDQLVSFGEFRAILTPFSEVIRKAVAEIMGRPVTPSTRPLLTAQSQVNNGRVASARSKSNGPIRVEAETILRVSVVDYPVTSL